MTDFQENCVEADGFLIRYLEAGSGPPLVHIHSAGGLRLSQAHHLLAESHSESTASTCIPLHFPPSSQPNQAFMSYVPSPLINGISPVLREKMKSFELAISPIAKQSPFGAVIRMA